MNFITLTRAEFLDSVQAIEDFRSLKFAKETLDLWDNFYSWDKFKPLCLRYDDEDLCYLFYTISKDNEYLIIHRLLTPVAFRRKNYAHEIMSQLFFYFRNDNIKRFKMNCMHGSLSFYNKLGLNYWGVNEQRQYYCDFKMPQNDISEITSIVKESDMKEFSSKKFTQIYESLKKNGSSFDLKEMTIHKACLDKLGKKFRYNEVLDQL
jgi:hypothetical protein